MMGYSQNFGHNFSIDESATPASPEPDRNRLAIDVDEIVINLSMTEVPDWTLHVNRRSNATRRSTSKSLKKISANRHEELIRQEEERRKEQEDQLLIGQRQEELKEASSPNVGSNDSCGLEFVVDDDAGMRKSKSDAKSKKNRPEGEDF